MDAVDDMEGTGGSSCGKPGTWVWGVGAGVISGIGSSSSSFEKS